MITKLPRTLVSVFLLALFGLFARCGFAETEGNQASRIEQPGIVLTFDDSWNLTGWAQRIPLLKQYDARLTLFIDKPDQIDEKRRKHMNQLSEIGCEMACHGFRHQSATEIVAKQDVQAYCDAEIVPAHEAMKKLGHTPRTFAYPYSSRNEQTDEALRKYYRHIRTGGGSAKQPFDKRNQVFVPVKEARERFLYFGISIDTISVEDVEKNVRPALERRRKTVKSSSFTATVSSRKSKERTRPTKRCSKRS